jgi:hypothetical protein
MRPVEELLKVAFKEPLSVEEDSALVSHFQALADAEPVVGKKAGSLKQSAFFACRAFDKGARDPEILAEYVKLLTEAQRVAPSDSFRRKLAEMKSAQKGKNSYEASLKKLVRSGEAGSKKLLATDEQLNGIEAELGVKLPASYRFFLTKYAHREIGTFEPVVAAELAAFVREAWDGGLEAHSLPFLEDNADHYCFDLRSKVEEPPIIFRPHDGTSKETWPNFAAWVEDCWLGELDE